MDLVVYAMERSETEEKFDDGGTSQLLWQHLSSQLIFFVLFQFASFPHMVLSLHQKVNCLYRSLLVREIEKILNFKNKHAHSPTTSSKKYLMCNILFSFVLCSVEVTRILKLDCVRLDVWKTSFTVREVHWSELPREVVQTSFLETFKVKLDRALSSLV